MRVGPFLLLLFAIAAASAAQPVVLHDFLADGFDPNGGVTLGPDGLLYGTALNGGEHGRGSLFRMNPDGSSYRLLYSFTGANGEHPFGAPILDGDGYLYGTATDGGQYAHGVVYRIATTGAGFQVLHSFSGNDGRSPLAPLIFAGATGLYGSTRFGGNWDRGTLFSIERNGANFNSFFSFDEPANSDHGNGPYGRLLLFGAKLYGTTYSGGNYNKGIVFSYNLGTTHVDVLHHFSGGGNDGAFPVSGLLRIDLQGIAWIYGTTTQGGLANQGSVFRIREYDLYFQPLRFFIPGYNEGGVPYTGLVGDVFGNLYGSTYLGGPDNAGTVFRISLSGSSYQVVHYFSGADGAGPCYGQALDASGFIYGAAENGGVDQNGVVYRVATSGGETPIHSFRVDGARPVGRLVEDGSGYLYGMTFNGGAAGFGTIFRVQRSGGGYTLLHSFSGADGKEPLAGLTFVPPDLLYGTTNVGGANLAGVIFRIHTDGSGFTKLADLFDGAGSRGAFPEAPLAPGGDGALYGTTRFGGQYNKGTLFKFALPSGPVETLVEFGPVEHDPWNAPFVSGGYLYGTTYGGGLADSGAIYRRGLDPPTYQVMHPFTGATDDGAGPLSAFVPDASGRLYGTTKLGGESDLGTVFRTSPGSVDVEILHSFTGGAAEGKWPLSSLTPDGGGDFFGVTSYAGPQGRGQIYRLHSNGAGFSQVHAFAGGLWGSDELAWSRGKLFGGTFYGGANDQGAIFSLFVPEIFSDDFETGDSESWTDRTP